MGLPMDNNLSEIHVPSGPTSTTYDRASLDGLTLRQLILKKDNLEEELKALGSVLVSHGVDMQTSLIDADGFPRADIDVAQVRVTRARIISLRNDWKDLMDRIEKGLHEYHAEMRTSGMGENKATDTTASGAESSSQAAAPAVRTPEVPETPFAKVNSVEPGSPANEAGLKVGDKIRRFGTAIWSNHANLRLVGENVQQNLGRPIVVKVVREGAGAAQEMELRLTPRQGWGGRGSLGCHVVPI